MNCTPYFHTNYTSSNTDYYTKVSVEVGNIGLFCVVRNKHNGSLQHQRYIYAQKPCNYRWYRGNSQEGFYKGLENLDWANISDEEKRNLYDCVKSLRYAKARFMSVANLSAEDSNYLNDYVKGLIMDFEYLFQNGTLPAQSAISTATPTTTPTPTAETQSTPISAEYTQSNATPAETSTEIPAETDEWNAIDLSVLTRDDLRNIIEMIQANGNPDGGIAYNGKTYAIANENGNMILKVKNAVFTTVPAQATTPTEIPAEKPIVRKTIQMAQMIDNKNLTEFVNGCFYRIVNNNTSNQFIGIANDKGETRMVKRNRVSVLNIYAEPPQA